MEAVLTRIRSEFGLKTMANGKTLISVFCDLSQVKQDQRLLRYLVEVDGHKALLEIEKLSPAMQQTRFQQTVNKLCTEMLVSEEAARQVCTAFCNAVYGSSAVSTPPQSSEKESVLKEETVYQNIQITEGIQKHRNRCWTHYRNRKRFPRKRRRLGLKLESAC